MSIALAAKNKSYAELKKAYHTILEKDCPQSVKDSVAENVKDWMQKRGGKELQVLAEHFPQQYQKKVYQQFRQKFEEYNDIDNTKYMKQLEEKRDMAEQSALKAFVNQQKIRPGDRKKLLSLAEAIRPMEYEEKKKMETISGVYSDSASYDGNKHKSTGGRYTGKSVRPVGSPDGCGYRAYSFWEK